MITLGDFDEREDDEDCGRRRIRAVNDRRLARAMSGEPGDPPSFLCEHCGQEECRCDTCGTCGKPIDDCECPVPEET